jgi:hypothetical protein
MRPVVVACVAFSALLGGAAGVRAQAPPPRPARLTYERSTGAAACPDEPLFRTMAASLLGGADPFVEGAPRRVAVSFRRSTSGYDGVATLYDGQDREEASERRSGRTCTSVAESLSTVVTYWLIPLGAPPSKPASAPPPRCEAAPVPPLPAPVCAPALPVAKPSPPPPRRPRFVVEAGSLLSFATVPRRPGFGVVAAAGARWPSFSLALEVRADLPSATDPTPRTNPPAYGTVWIFSNTLAPCVHLGWFVGCGLVSGGVLANEAVGPVAFTQVLPYAALGVQAGIELPLSAQLSLRASADLRVPMLHASTIAGGTTIWIQPPVGGDLGLRLVAAIGGP